MTLQELYDAITVRGLNRDILFLEVPCLPTETKKVVLVDSKVLEKYGQRIVHDVFPVFEQKKIYVWLKATNKELAEAFLDGWNRDI